MQVGNDDPSSVVVTKPPTEQSVRVATVLATLQPSSSDEDRRAAFSAVTALSSDEVAAVPDDGISLLMLACSAGAIECVKWLLEFGSDVGAVDMFGCDALFYAVRSRCQAVVDTLLQAGVPTDRMGKAGGSALIEAAVVGDVEIVSLLCAAAADPNAADAFGDNAVKAALRSSRWDVAALIGSYGAKWSKAEMACSEGGWHCKQAAAALEAGRSAYVLGIPGVSLRTLPFSIDADGRTPLHACALRNWPDGARWLLHARANPAARDARGRDAMYVAASRSHHVVLHMLIANGANPHSTTRHESATPLMAAAAAGAPVCVVMLWRCLLDMEQLEATDVHGRTALRVAIAEGADVGTVALLMGLTHRKSAGGEREMREAMNLLRAVGRSSDRAALKAVLAVCMLMDSGLVGGLNLPDVSGLPDGASLQAEDAFMWGVALRNERVERDHARQRQKAKREHARRRRAKVVSGSPKTGAMGGSGGGGSGAGAGSLGRSDEEPYDGIADGDGDGDGGGDGGGADADGSPARPTGGGGSAAAAAAGGGGMLSRFNQRLRAATIQRASGATLLREDALSDEAESETPSEILARLQLEPGEMAQLTPSNFKKDAELRRRMHNWQTSSQNVHATPNKEEMGQRVEAEGPADGSMAPVPNATAESADGDAASLAPSALAELLRTPRLPTAKELELLLYDTSTRAIAPEAFDNDAPDIFRPAAAQGELVLRHGLVEEGESLLAIEPLDDEGHAPVIDEDRGGVARPASGWRPRSGSARAATASEPPYLLTERKLKALERRTRKE